MKTKNLILTAVAILGIAAAVSGCGVMSSNVRTTGAGQGINPAKVTPGISEIGFIRDYGNPTRILKTSTRSGNRFYNYTVLLYCLSKTARSHFLFNLINNKAVHNSCKAFYFLHNKIAYEKDPLLPDGLNDNFTSHRQK